MEREISAALKEEFEDMGEDIDYSKMQTTADNNMDIDIEDELDINLWIFN